MSQSFIPWIDASNPEEPEAEVKEHDTRDELGLGSVRNAFADLFFPGTSVLQTRARYFLFVPWLYLHLESRLVPSTEIAGHLKEGEVRLMAALKRAGEEGVIGQVAGAGLRRFPSGIYWTGLRRWGILRQGGTRQRYYRSLDAFYLRRQHRLTTDEGRPVEGWAEANWDPALPPAPPGFPNSATFELAADEAAYLRERVAVACRGSLLAALVGRGRRAGEPPLSRAGQAWLAPGVAELPAEQQRWLDHARRFSRTMYGAVLLYNLMLAELRRDDELAAGHRARLAAWRAALDAEAADLRAWSLDDFWRLVKSIGRVPWPAESFIRDWLALLLNGGGGPDADAAAGGPARALVRARETALKGSRSRFESPAHLAVWSGAAGLAPLDYRWAVARTLIDDIG